MEQATTTDQVTIGDLATNQKVPYCEGTIVAKEPARFLKTYAFTGLRSVAILRDSTGEIRLNLYDAEASEVELGDKIAVHNGWVSEHQGDRVLSSGKFGRLSVFAYQD